MARLGGGLRGSVSHTAGEPRDTTFTWQWPKPLRSQMAFFSCQGHAADVACVPRASATATLYVYFPRLAWLQEAPFSALWCTVESSRSCEWALRALVLPLSCPRGITRPGSVSWAGAARPELGAHGASSGWNVWLLFIPYHCIIFTKAQARPFISPSICLLADPSVA